MTASSAKIASVVVAVIGVIGVVATIWFGTDPGRYWFTIALVVVIAVALGYRWALARVPALEAIPRRPEVSLDTELGDAEEVWFSWHSGSVKVAQGDLFKRPRIIRMVLTHPDSQALKEVAKISNLSACEMASDIKALTAALQQKSASILWFDGPVANSIVIADPEQPSGWARIEVLLPFGNPAYRPSIKVRNSNAPELFARIKKAFVDLENASSAPQ